ncbi:MAG TPA: pyridoxamine 5'-phosphate oxidase family protein [Pseudonocardia sp.]|jgi:PPOX class probable F420-dependent enzyme|nr:pyridoxamine 5'-phosphate oxidase family protein [Pseudonocardia sp.]
MLWAEVAGDPDFQRFWTERRIGMISTVRSDGRPHTVMVGIVVDFETGIARVIARGGSVKVRNVRAAGAPGAPVNLSQSEGGSWSSLQGIAVIRDDPASVADAEHRYARRYRVPKPNPARVVIEVAVVAVLGRW